MLDENYDATDGVLTEHSQLNSLQLE